MAVALISLCYLIGALCFVWGLRMLSSPDTARRGNIWAAFGMSLAIIATLVAPIEGAPNNYLWIAGGMILGGIIGWIAARKVQMTAMPQMVSIFNGLGGACAAVLAMVELTKFYNEEIMMSGGELTIALIACLIGAVSFTGSMLAYGKLEGLVRDRNVILPGHTYINIVLLMITLVLVVVIIIIGQSAGLVLPIIFLILALVYGYSFVAPIGGADMPVVISLLNSFTGLSAAGAGLIYGNNLMLIGGIFVGASGTILTIVMCEAMNRSLFNVILGGFGSAGATGAVADGDEIAKEVSIYDMAIQLNYAGLVVFVPGYGLAVAQAQKICKELEDLLEENGVEVKYAIHPVAGRMPGHMNVLLAEADVPYPKLLDLEEANDALKNADVAVIIGANDVVNPAALNEPGSPIYGMPVLRVWEAKNVIILKRSMSPGYAGIPNPLFFYDNARMLFGDAKDSLQKIVAEVKNL